MTPSAELLEDLQKTYASQYGLTLIFTDEYGNLLWTIEGDNELCNTLLHQEESNLLAEIKKSLSGGWNLSRAVIYDMLPGIQVAVAPVLSGSGAAHFLWAGMLVEEQAQETAEKQLSAMSEFNLDWAAILRNTPIITKENKQKWLKRMSKLAELAALFFQQERSGPSPELPVDLLRQALHSGSFDFSAFLSEFLEQNKEIDFVGLAEQRGQDSYKVTEVTGQGTAGLIGTVFSPGEGFLGRPLLTEERTYWENTERDRRSMIFRSLPSKPKSLFCEPIRRQDGSLSLIFGGSFSNRHVSAEMAALSRTLTMLLEVGLSVQSLRQDNAQQLARLNSLVDICKLMASAPDLRRILFMLVDISINLAEGPFSCVIIKDNEHNKIQLVSRGDFGGQLENYAKDVTKRSRYLSTHTIPGSQEPHLYTTATGDRVIECPLLQGNELFGILCVGVSGLADSQLQEHLAFLQTLSIIGGVSLQLAGRKEKGEAEEKTDALHRAIAQFDPSAFKLSEEAAEVAAEFTAKSGFPPASAKDIIQACQLVSYSPEFIRELFPESRVATILEEGKTLNAGEQPETSVGAASLVFALVHAYVKSNRRLDELAHLEKAGEDLYGQFISFIRSSHVVETEFMLSDSDTEEENQTVTDAIGLLSDLSPREKEVLSLITEGMNNREIASTLFISDHTVKNHVTKIFQKLGVSDRAHAISKVYRSIYSADAKKKRK